jgi:endonuclease-3 related protein
MPSFDESFAEILDALAARFPAAEAPEHAPFPALVAALLGRAAEPRKVARALAALDDAGLLDPQALAEADPAEVADTLKATGVASPARALGPLRRLARWLVERHHGSADALRAGEVATETLREELAQLNGIGPATADALLLFALRRPVYPLDRATYRIFLRHGWLDPATEYDEARAVVERPAGDDPDALARLADGLERVGREFCRARVAKCDRCPLRPFLPEGGPIEMDADS